MLEQIEIFTQKFKACSALLLVLLVSLMGLTACGGSDGDEAFREAVKVNDLNITLITISSPNTINSPGTIQIGAEEAFTAMATIDSGASAAIDITNQVRWTSSDSSVISINSSGRAIAINDGTVEIRAELADLFGSQELSASSAELTSIEISIEDALTSVGVCTLNQKLTAMGTFDDGRVSDVTSDAIWTSSAPEVIEISNEAGSKGTLTSFIVGATVISAGNGNGVVSNDLSLAVTDTLDSITVTPDNVTVVEGGSQQFLAIGSYSDLVDDQDITTTVTWSTLNTDGITAAHLSISNEDNAEGLATAISEGGAEVSAACGDNSTSVAVTILEPITITGIQINAGRAIENGDVGDSPIELTATIQFSDGSTDRDITDDTDTTKWRVESEDSGEPVTVSDTGVVTITAVGTTTIQVAFDDGGATSITDTIQIVIE
jgi:hypothetical protein